MYMIVTRGDVQGHQHIHEHMLHKKQHRTTRTRQRENANQENNMILHKSSNDNDIKTETTIFEQKHSNKYDKHKNINNIMNKH